VFHPWDRARASIAVIQSGDDPKPAIVPGAIVKSIAMGRVVAQFMGEHDPALPGLFCHQVFSTWIVHAKNVPGKGQFGH
jgi:hypothetical protein